MSPGLQDELRQAEAEAEAEAEAATRNEHWTGTHIATWIAKRLGHPVSYHMGWRYLVRIKHSLQGPRPRHTLADTGQQDAFKKN